MTFGMNNLLKRGEMKTKKSSKLIVVAAVTLAIVFASVYLLSKRDKNEYLSVRVIIDSVGFGRIIAEPVISDLLVKVGEETVVSEYRGYDMITLTVLEVKSETVVVELSLHDILYPWMVYTSEIESSDFWKRNIDAYVDEIPKNTCYRIVTKSADSGIVVYLTLDIKESEKHLTCGHGRALVMWYEGEKVKIGIIKDKRIKAETWKVLEVMKNPMTVEEILNYLLSSGCKRCLSPMVFETEEASGDLIGRVLTEEEMNMIQELYPELPYCK